MARSPLLNGALSSYFRASCRTAISVSSLHFIIQIWNMNANVFDGSVGKLLFWVLHSKILSL